ncbi:porin [Azospirillum halopraeferens]|uniref:porin n=1 Tax=Azospirillum halopraeferens TaxID=34010 RepID=UPI00040FE80D|nr:porin [Azospirillum halopraeferens]
MNRYLLAGCAAVALAMGSGAANAQAKFEVKIGGDVFFEAGYAEDDISGNRSVEFRNRFRVNITPTAKADNGLEYGGRVRLRANRSDATVDGDHAYIFVQGTFGQVRLGVTNSFNDDTYVSRPIGYMFLGQTTPGDVYLSGLPFHDYSLVPEGSGTKIRYASPVFAGFQVGASYTPRAGDYNNSVVLTQDDASVQDMFEIGANYKGTFAGVSVNASAGYFWGDAEPTATGVRRDDLRAWQVGGQVGYAGFLVGAGYVDYDDSLQPSGAVGIRDAYSWNAGVQYTTGPIVVGAGYTYGQGSRSTSTTAAAVAVANSKLDLWSVGLAYTVAPGLTVGAEYNYFDLNTPTGFADRDGSVVMLRSIVAF